MADHFVSAGPLHLPGPLHTILSARARAEGIAPEALLQRAVENELQERPRPMLEVSDQATAVPHQLHLPKALHSVAKANAALEHLTLQEYLQRAVARECGVELARSSKRAKHG